MNTHTIESRNVQKSKKWPKGEALDGNLRAIWGILYLWTRVVYDFSSSVARKHVFFGRAVAGIYVLSGRCQEKMFTKFINEINTQKMVGRITVLHQGEIKYLDKRKK